MPIVLLVLCLSVACVGRGLPASDGLVAVDASPLAPNGSVVTARVTDAIVVEATTLGIEPPQPICVLTLVVTSSDVPTGLLPANAGAGGAIQVYSKETDLLALKGGSLTASIIMRGAGSAARLWIVDVLASSPPQ